MEHNPYEVFERESMEIFPFQQKQSVEQRVNTDGQNKIKKRRIIHKASFGRGANHPSFFLRKFFSKLDDKLYQRIYKDYPNIFQNVYDKANRCKISKSRFNLQDLNDFFGESEDAGKQRQNYLNSKMFFQVISEKAVDLIMEESKCNQILNHLISIEKYSGRLGNPKLVGRVQFQ